ncbi:MAG TPA: ABC transporter ATP-binding protein [Chitinispirillaceae bacterium]|nr:ABC transporter ATP-binding protein [Chitinispirillaceae bacterium]
MNKTGNILDIINLSVTYSQHKNQFKALNEITLSVKKGEVIGLVGESGCGKTTLGRTIVRLQKEESGNIIFDGTDLCSLNSSQLRIIRRKMQMVFQNPYSSLDPRMSILDIIAEAIPQRLTSTQKIEHVSELMMTCGLEPDMMRKFPHEFSGGQRQRIAIARALAAQPSLIIADEPVSSLDVSVQAQILNTLKKLHQTFSLTILFISHDLAVVKYLCTKVAVMYKGIIVECGPSEQLLKAPAHPYTKALLNAIPTIDPDARQRCQPPVPDTQTDHYNRGGCPCTHVCPHAVNLCKEYIPILKNGLSENHQVACTRYDELKGIL